MNIIIKIIINIILVNFYINQVAGATSGGSICVSQETCGKCLSADWSCSWCTDRSYDMRKSRCMTKKELVQAQCGHEYIYENVDTPTEYLANNKPYDYEADSLEAVQIQPQSIKIKLRKMQTKTIKMIYRPAKNYPLDLYYLMDLTWSMKDDKQTLVNVGNDLVNTLLNLTENYRMGFGSFADKPSMPFILPGEKLQENPCAPDQDICEPTYSYRHRLSLTRNISEFINKVNGSDVTANLDNLEGGLDALMQILVCESQIGWDTQSRKIVLFASDGQMHFAGDGLLAGVVKKNDKLCHLSDEGDYLESLELDYPSLEEIYRELLKRKVNVIFAVTQDVIQVYDQIHSLMQEISSVGILKMDSSNILELVNNGYKEFARKVQFFDNAPSNFIITYETKCGSLYRYAKQQSRCDNIEIGKEYEFYVNITLKDYPEDVNITSEQIKIEEASLSSEFLLVDIDYEDECPCLMDEIGDKNSLLCNRKGEMKCGMCFCDPGWAGTTCECDLLNYESSKQLDNLCRLQIADLREGVDALKLGSICSDRGECNCGKCNCNLGFSGKYCECTGCPYYQDEICGGTERATCECGHCVCKTGWSGKRCDCTTSQTLCIAPNDTRICSANGQCECGKCKCKNNFYGSFCESNSTSSGSSLCLYYEPCVKCFIQRKNNVECNDIVNVCRGNDGSEFIPEYYSDLSGFPIKCLVRLTNKDNEPCDHHFSYMVDDELKNHLKIQYNECVKSQTAAVISGVIIIATFVIGALLICLYKIVTMIKDHREFAQFKKNNENTTYYNQQSPIYKSPITKYEVPDSLIEKQMEMNKL